MIRFMRRVKTFLSASYRIPEFRENAGQRTYAALAGDGLMPEMMPPLASEEHQNSAPTKDDSLGSTEGR